MSQNNNPFADAWKSFDASFKALQSGTPSVDFNDVFANGQKNFETLAAAQKAFAEGAQAVAKRQVEIAQGNAEEAMKLFKDVASSKDPKESANKQADFAKTAFEKAASDAKEIAEIAAKSQNKVIELVGGQVSDNLKKMSTAAKTTKAA